MSRMADSSGSGVPGTVMGEKVRLGRFGRLGCERNLTGLLVYFIGRGGVVKPFIH